MRLRHLPAIDGLRAVAVLAVVAYHAGLGGAGYVGVDIFFVISGYLITRLLVEEQVGLLDFYARRVRRILPAAALVVLATLVAAMVLLPPVRLVHAANSAGAALVFGANVFFQFTTGGYFDPSAEEMPLLHLWSLSVEEQFYLLWPFVLLLSRRSVVGIAIGSFVVAEILLQWAPGAAFYQMPARAWELAAGGLVALYGPRIRGAAAIGSALLALSIVLPIAHFPGIGALPAVAGSALILVAVHAGERIRWLEWRPMTWIGLISYSLYLWHWPLLALYRATSIEPSLGATLALCGASVVLAAATYRYIEQPFRRMRSPSARTLATGAACSLVVALSACGYAWSTRPDERFAQPDRRCHVRRDEVPMPKCPPGDVVVWGDSMAYSWTPAFPEATSATRDACAPRIDHPDQRCRAFNARVLATLPEGAVVILAALWESDADLRATFAALDGRRVLVLGPSPTMRKAVPSCLSLECGVSRTSFDAFARPLLGSLRAQAAPYPNVEVRDVSDDFCTRTSCPPVLDGIPLYWDTHHIAKAQAERLGERMPRIEARITSRARGTADPAQ